MLSQWVETLSELGLSAEEIADTTWLWLVQQRAENAGIKSVEPQQDSRSTIQPNTPKVVKQQASGSSDKEAQRPPARQQQKTPQVGIYEQSSQAQNPVQDSELVAPIKIMEASALGDPLALTRALRPLMQEVPTGRAKSLDEAATVQRIAEEKVWWPVMQPEFEPWLELALVIDESRSMLIWRHTVQELIRLFKHYGLFRDVRVWGLVDASQVQGSDPETSEQQATSPAVFIRPEFGRQSNEKSLRSPDVLIDPNRRRLVVIMSDCVSPVWQSGSVFSALAVWSKQGPMALLQMLPEWMWPRTVLRYAQRVKLLNLEPGATNQELVTIRSLVSAQQESNLRAQAIPTPVISLDAAQVAQWSKMVSSRGGVSSGGVSFYPELQASAMRREQQRKPQTAVERTAGERVDRFMVASSRGAKRLAGLVAAAPVVNLRVIRLIVRAMQLEDFQPVHVAEVFLGGLMKSVTPITLETESDAVEYQFFEGVRERLIPKVPMPNTQEVLMKVSADINPNLGKETLDEFVAELRAWLEREEGTGQDSAKPFATVAAAVLRQQGPRYADFIDLVQQRYGGTVDQPRALIEFPPLNPTPFIAARLIPKTATEPNYPTFPPLSTIELEMVKLTVEVEPEGLVLHTDEVEWIKFAVEEAESKDGLETFEFTIAKLVQKRTGLLRRQQWVIEESLGQAQRYLEPLPNNGLLEMVAIPGGRFVMGSPKGETGRFDQEFPQHLVTVPPFFMGRYPVTQAQWRRVVKAAEGVERELRPNPARFKGDNLPVEQVSWEDAVEFCQRLSALTGREYRLPSEAEWEYACRAVISEQLSVISGELTVKEWNQRFCEPFHFGQMITTDVANYDGDYVFGGGPKGKYRKKTTPVDHFGYANAFGLSDMHGNVREWCADHWHDNYKGAPIDGTAWTEGDDSNLRILRGGSWLLNPRYCRSAFRLSISPGYRDYRLGFRVVCSAPGQSSPLPS